MKQTNYKLCGVIALAALLQMAVILKLYAMGVIDKLIPWDECAYLYTGMNNADNLLHNPFALDTFKNLTLVHSPLSYVQTTLAEMVFNFSPAGPYVVNFFYLALLFAIFAQRLKEASLVSLIAIVLVFVTTPYMFVFTSYIKPDFLAGTLFFILLASLFKSEPRITYAKSDVLKESLLIAGVLAAKPIACYMPVLLIGTFFTAGLRDFICHKNHVDRVAIKKHYGLLTAMTLAVFAIVFISHLDAFIDFFRTGLLSTLPPNISLWDRLIFYINPDAEEDLWGSNPLIFELVMALFIYKIGTKPEKKHVTVLLALLAITIASYIPITFFPYIGKALGAVFAACCMFIIFYAFEHVQFHYKRTAFLNVFIIVFCLYHFTLPTRRYPDFFNATQENVLQADALVDKFSRAMIKDSKSDPNAISMYFSLIGPIPSFDLGIRIYSLAGFFPNGWGGIHEEGSFNGDFIRNDLKEFNYIILIDPPEVMAKHQLPNGDSLVHQKELQTIFFTSWNSIELSNAQYNGITYHLYKRLSRKS